jgi:diguanylate cyclase (GGDEF)-like protein/PAS domain S-box-containing protein
MIPENSIPAPADLERTQRAELIFSASYHLLKHSREKIFIKDKDLIYRAASTKFAKMAGWEEESDLIGKTDFDIFDDQELAQRYREDDLMLIEQQADLIDYVEPITEKDGKPRYASTSKFILRDDNGEFIGLVGVSKDITMEYYLQRNRMRELEYLFTLPHDVYFAAYLDLDDWRIVSEHHQTVNGFDFTYHGSIDTLATNAYDRLPDNSQRARDFYQNFRHDVLASLYQHGQREMVMEYQRQLSSVDVRWVRDEIHFLQDAISGHLCMMLVVRDIQQRKLDEAEQIRLAEQDEVTGLLNRKATMQLIRGRLAQSAANEQHALFMIDADYFKDVNNTYGHQAGDQALADFAKAIGSNFRSTDVIGRIGGDEFFVLMTNVPDRRTVETKANALLTALRAVHYESIHLGASIGICLYPADATSLEDMYGLSDQAMYAVKDAGRNDICFVADLMAHQR